jgi:hypothetical protein
VLAVSDLALIILAATDESFAHDGISPSASTTILELALSDSAAITSHLWSLKELLKNKLVGSKGFLRTTTNATRSIPTESNWPTHKRGDSFCAIPIEQ